MARGAEHRKARTARIAEPAKGQGRRCAQGEVVRPDLHRLGVVLRSSGSQDTTCNCDWSSDVYPSDLGKIAGDRQRRIPGKLKRAAVGERVVEGQRRSITQ